jgi:hemerythrin-like domain-containing protein
MDLTAQEKNLIEAGERLGEAMKQASPEEKRILREMKDQVESFAKEEEAKGRLLDRSALFAAGIIAHPDITNEVLLEAAKNYIDMDYLFVKSLEEASA